MSLEDMKYQTFRWERHMKKFIEDYLPYAGAGFVTGVSLGVLLFVWAYVSVL